MNSFEHEGRYIVIKCTLNKDSIHLRLYYNKQVYNYFSKFHALLSKIKDSLKINQQKTPVKISTNCVIWSSTSRTMYNKLRIDKTT